MHKLTALALSAALALGACSDGPVGTSEPDVAPTSAPGLAWQFSYDYVLDDERISAVQEAHAGACERLGVTRCRITGLQYNIDNMSRVTGTLQVKLDPAIARQFGKQATASVAQHNGRLISSRFAGEDVGTQIGSAQGHQGDLQARIAEIERRLASATPGDREATELQAQLDALRRAASDTRAVIAGGQQRLATTPMTFNYHGEGGVAGFDENPIKASWRLMAESAVTMVSVVLKVLGVLLPWLLLLALLVILARSRAGRGMLGWWRRSAPARRDEE